MKLWERKPDSSRLKSTQRNSGSDVDSSLEEFGCDGEERNGE